MLPHQTSGSYFTIKTSLPNAGKDYPVDLPPALHSLGRFYCTRKPYEPDCFYLRWENVGDLSGVETLLLEQSDVLGEMTGSRRKGQMRVTWGKRGVLTMQSILVILLSATQEKQTRMERALSASALRESSLQGFCFDCELTCTITISRYLLSPLERRTPSLPSPGERALDQLGAPLGEVALL